MVVPRGVEPLFAR